MQAPGSPGSSRTCPLHEPAMWRKRQRVSVSPHHPAARPRTGGSRPGPVLQEGLQKLHQQIAGDLPGAGASLRCGFPSFPVWVRSSLAPAGLGEATRGSPAARCWLKSLPKVRESRNSFAASLWLNSGYFSGLIVTSLQPTL